MAKLSEEFIAAKITEWVKAYRERVGEEAYGKDVQCTLSTSLIRDILETAEIQDSIRHNFVHGDLSYTSYKVMMADAAIDSISLRSILRGCELKEL